MTTIKKDCMHSLFLAFCFIFTAFGGVMLQKTTNNLIEFVSSSEMIIFKKAPCDILTLLHSFGTLTTVISFVIAVFLVVYSLAIKNTGENIEEESE